MSDIKVKDIRGLSEEQLKNQLQDLKENLLNLRAKQQNVRAGEIKRVRKSIARTLTVINLNARAQVAANITDPKLLPKDMRPKLTRALRRRMTPQQENAKTLRTQKKQKAFPKRAYALKA